MQNVLQFFRGQEERVLKCLRATKMKKISRKKKVVFVAITIKNKAKFISMVNPGSSERDAPRVSHTWPIEELLRIDGTDDPIEPEFGLFFASKTVRVTASTLEERNDFLATLVHLTREAHIAVTRLNVTELNELGYAQEEQLAELEEESKETDDNALMSAAEERDLQTLLNSWDGSADAQAFEEKLMEQLKTLEEARPAPLAPWPALTNVQAFLESDRHIEAIVEGTGTAAVALEQLQVWVDSCAMILKETHVGMAELEEENNRLQMQTTSHQRLLDKLAEIMRVLHVDPETEAIIARKPINMDPQAHIRASQALQQLMGTRLEAGLDDLQFVNPHPTPGHSPQHSPSACLLSLPPPLEFGGAAPHPISPHLPIPIRPPPAASLRMDLARKIFEFLTTKFAFVAEELANDKTRLSKRNFIKLDAHTELFQKLEPYASLVASLRSTDEAQFQALLKARTPGTLGIPPRPAYMGAMRFVYKRELQTFFDEFRSVFSRFPPSTAPPCSSCTRLLDGQLLHAPRAAEIPACSPVPARLPATSAPV
ncbi:hypothetical protein PAPYR_2571 [Paratrimastix pyriformis]|uniref:Exocyst complex component Sec3 PIP2-binding N-terminal domain-containing protein n=1 Tax=Paratrimastix pyriformis TaxID=342808 RepID=A0ABQ8US07_9EUKA|nr:hypothetical protein PAPYR_2571 [Paratrimastix pyriformis]